MSHRRSHFGDIHIVQHYDIGASGESFIDLFRPFDFHLNLHEVRDPGACSLHGLAYSAGGLNVVVLNQDAIRKAKAVVCAAAYPNRVLFKYPQPRRRLSRVDNDRSGAGDRGGVCGGDCGDTGEALQEIKRYTLGSENPGRISIDFGNAFSLSGNTIAVGQLGGKANGAIDLPKCFAKAATWLTYSLIVFGE